MDDLIRQDGYSFKRIKEINKYRPYRIRCVETGSEQESSISYQDAINLLLGAINFAKKQQEIYNNDSDAVKEVFERALLGRKKSECNDIVSEQIINRGLITGDIYQMPERERFQSLIEYRTEHFLVGVHFERGLFCGATKITLEKIEE